MEVRLYSLLASYVGRAIIVYGTYALRLSKDFNAGQEAVLDRSSFSVDLDISHFDYRIGPILLHSQEINTFDFDYKSPHPEAIDQFLGEAIDMARIAVSYMEYGPSTKRFEDAAEDAYEYYQRSVGFFG